MFANLPLPSGEDGAAVPDVMDMEDAVPGVWSCTHNPSCYEP